MAYFARRLTSSGYGQCHDKNHRKTFDVLPKMLGAFLGEWKECGNSICEPKQRRIGFHQ